MSLRQIKGNLSDLEERIILALYILHKNVASIPEWQPYQQSIVFRGRGVADLLGGKWKNYRHKIMLELQKKEWVEVVWLPDEKTASKWAYRLSSVGYMTMEDRASRAVAGSVKSAYVIPEELPLFSHTGNGEVR